ncbi:MAG: hypothetical protein EX285_04250 [Thaumarchaeota archaeon]|nr:hypothetical protein [Nitrososphaerota archaeon]
MSITIILDELKTQIERNKDSMINMSKINPNKAFTRINQLAHSVSAKYGVVLQLHFLDPKKITDTNSYGNENLSILVDPKRKQFSIPRDSIKEKANEFLDQVEIKDAYMYEGKEGVKVFLQNGRIDILPGSIHIWCQIDGNVMKFIDWLFTYCYDIKPI